MRDDKTTSSALIPQPSSLSKPLNGHWDPLRKVHRRQSNVSHLFLEQIAGEAVQVDGSACGVEGIDVAGQKRGHDSAEDVAHSAAGHAGIPRRIHVDVTFGISDQSLE